jgi:hypothetical protein
MFLPSFHCPSHLLHALSPVLSSTHFFLPHQQFQLQQSVPQAQYIGMDGATAVIVGGTTTVIAPASQAHYSPWFMKQFEAT